MESDEYNNFNYSIKWLVASKVYGHVNSLSSKLCLMEKCWITKYFDDRNLLIKNSALTHKCIRQDKILIMNIKR